MKSRNRIGGLWIAAGIILLGLLTYAYLGSPFVDATGDFARFERSRAVPAGLIGMAGTIIILVWGRLLLRGGGSRDRRSGTEE